VKWRAVAFLVWVGCAVGPVSGGSESADFEAERQKFQSVATALTFYQDQLSDVLAKAADSGEDATAVQRTVDALGSMAGEVSQVEDQLARVMDDAVAVHLRGDPNAIRAVLSALAEVQNKAQSMQDSIDEFLAYEPGRVVPQEVVKASKDLKISVLDSPLSVGFRYYRAFVPIRFVQFVEADTQILDDERLQLSIDITNRVFRPAAVRFLLFANIAVWNSEFTYLHRRLPDGTFEHDANGGLVEGTYAWPQEICTSPLVWPLYWPQVASCAGFVLPEGGTESRSWAQRRAGTYCCRRGEMLVYINQGRSNGGEYPWYSRIIGMTSGHMAQPLVPQNYYVFAHEVGHYFGLPHTFPSHLVYGIDYDLARMINCPAEGPPEPGQQRFYEPHPNLVNPETGEMAELSLFWDLVYKPLCFGTMDPGVYCLFFNSRQEAAKWEKDLQPIEQWSNGHLYGHGSMCCGNYGKSARLQLTVGTGCRGVEDDFSDCICPAQDFCTGHPGVAAFSRHGSTPDTIQLNVMSYGYPTVDGPPVEVESEFLCQSQLEQIDRVLTHDVDTFFFPGKSGMRPSLRNCSSCHP
jgi:hypothetical protein